MSIFTKEVDSGLEGKLPKRELRKWAKWALYITAAGTIGYFANKWTGDPTGLEKKLGLDSPLVRTLVFDSKEYRAIKAEGNYYYVDDLIKINEYMSKLKPDERSSFGVVYVSRFDDKLIFPVLIKKGISDNSYTDPVEVIIGELKEGEKYITGRETSSSTTTTQTNQPNITRILGIR